MESILLKILDLFRALFTLAKIDYEQLRAIVAIKLTMDNRRQIVAYRRKENQDPGNAFAWTMFFYMLFGGFIAMAFYSVPFMIAMIIFFSYIMVMIAMTLITDFSSVLLDTSDNTIILPRPVDSRTLFIARLTHILLYLGQLTAGLSIIPCLVVMLKFGVLFLLLFFIAIILSVITAVFITNAFYLLIMQFANEEKLKNVINYFQIFMAVAIMGGYQLMPRMMNRFGAEDPFFEIHWWSYFAPPVWMAGALETFQFGIKDLTHIVLTTCAIVIPPAGFYMVNRYLTPVFSRKLGAMGSNIERTSQRTKTEKDNFITNISGWLTTSACERGAFELIYKILGRDRKIKLKIYPSFGYIIVFGLIFVVRSNDDFATSWAALPGTQYHLLLLYLTFMVLQVALHEIPYSDDFKASWIYFSSPVDKPGELLTGTIKAIFIRLFIPGYIAISLVVVYIWGVTVLDDIVFGLFNNFLMLMILALLGKRHLPMSMAPSVRGQTGNFLRGLLTLLLIGALGFSHYLLTQRPLILIGIIPVQLLILYVLLKWYKQTKWSVIKY